MSPQRLPGWRCWVEYVFQDENNPRHFLRVLVEKYTPWTKAICKLARAFAFIVTAGRRRSWLPDRIYSYWWPALLVYLQLRQLLLYQTRHVDVVWQPTLNHEPRRVYT